MNSLKKYSSFGEITAKSHDERILKNLSVKMQYVIEWMENDDFVKYIEEHGKKKSNEEETKEFSSTDETNEQIEKDDIIDNSGLSQTEQQDHQLVDSIFDYGKSMMKDYNNELEATKQKEINFAPKDGKQILHPSVMFNSYPYFSPVVPVCYVSPYYPFNTNNNIHFSPNFN
ncbi:hypothetical protein SNEBB_006302 [Seison nebaliae]|nr:hypothetical protein SNEBB_006302 [Seison nebaliae]